MRDLAVLTVTVLVTSIVYPVIVLGGVKLNALLYNYIVAVAAKKVNHFFILILPAD